ncbi:MAG TPA: hypothetical protein ENF66_00445 [Firmicutes bacterium]|nr:hypothetical protein [Caldisericia bacterium]HDH63143.1 hypothetical protein [Bacillota bacterium]
MPKIGRFQVMATLQAARAYVLGLSLEEAKSFGLNRAIFYAAAKRGFKEKVKEPKGFLIKEKGLRKEEIERIQKTFSIFKLGDEMAYSVEIDGKRYFVIGGEIQRPEDFKKQIERRFKGKFDKAFKEALEIVKNYDKGVLLSQRNFYEVVYKPRRDTLKDKWSKLVEEEK